MSESNKKLEWETSQLVELTGRVSNHIERHCSKEIANLVRDNVQNKFNNRKSIAEIADYQIEQLTHYLAGRIQSLQEHLKELQQDNSQLLLDNQRNIKDREQAEALVHPVQQENLQLRALLVKEGASKELIESLVGERRSQEKKDLEVARKKLRDLEIRYKQLQQEYEASRDTSFFHKEPTPSTSGAAEQPLVYTKLLRIKKESL